jgi:hypothetical protein
MGEKPSPKGYDFSLIISKTARMLATLATSFMKGVE